MLYTGQATIAYHSLLIEFTNRPRSNFHNSYYGVLPKDSNISACFLLLIPFFEHRVDYRSVCAAQL